MLPEEIASMGQFYLKLDAKPKMKDGDAPYPRPGYEEGNIGMSVEFRYATSIECFPDSTHENNTCTETSRSIIHPQRPTVLPCPTYLLPFSLETLSS